MSAASDPRVARLFEPLAIGSWRLRNRIVMAPMTRNFSPGGLPGEDVAAYYERRAAQDVGLIVTEGVAIAHPSAHGYRDVPVLDPSVPLQGWKDVVARVHGAGGTIVPQLWHVGSIRKLGRGPDPAVPGWGPSAIAHPAYGDRGPAPHAMSERDVATILDAFRISAELAMEAGFDGVEIHGAHGYLLDQFAWPATNARTDAFAAGPAFGAAVVRAVRGAIGPERPIVYRFSQWKLGAYDAVLWPDEASLARFLLPLVEAGVDVFHPSTRRLLVPAFAGGDETLARVTKRITGKPVIGVGSVGLDVDITSTADGARSSVASIDAVLERFVQGDFDLLAVGRAILAEPRWATLVREGRLHEAAAYSKDSEATLV